MECLGGDDEPQSCLMRRRGEDRTQTESQMESWGGPGKGQCAASTVNTGRSRGYQGMSGGCGLHPKSNGHPLELRRGVTRSERERPGNMAKC